ncbi:co-regulatory protein PtrA N-terminal domain-containing protein [Pseudomonas juntendi]|nr:co-regulatory protein PtrA N-terminal domain-containing protein [Pseudomonas juntendi]
MNMVKAIVMVVTFGMAGIALAEGGADRTFARMEAALQSSMQASQVAQGKKSRRHSPPSPASTRATKAADPSLQKSNHPGI